MSVAPHLDVKDRKSTRAESPMGQVLLLSMRRAENIVAYAANYEFEDVIAEVTGAERVDVESFQPLELPRKLYKLTRAASGSARLSRKALIKNSSGELTRDYDLFFPVFNHPHELFALNTIPNWRERCKVAACFVGESFLHQLPEYLLELLSDFDHIFVGSKSVVDAVSHVTGRPCSWLTFASNVVAFAPPPNQPRRPIDVCSIGRRSDVTHEALMKIARNSEFFYYYDTVAASGVGKKQRSFRVGNASEHRLLLANVLKRSRYFLASLSRANEPELHKGRQEIAGRFYEGISAGAVLLGQPPNCPEFAEQFDWPDSVITMPFDSPDIGSILAELDADPARLERIGRDNLRNAALRHDWSCRLRQVYDTLGLPPTAGMLRREDQLRRIADFATP